MRPNLTVICGPTCGGKTTLRKQMAEQGYSPIVCSTTRPPRPGEIDTIDYNFVDQHKFQSDVDSGKLILVRSFKVVSGDVWKYGVPVSELESTANDKPRLLILDAKGVRDIKHLNYDPFIIMVNARVSDLWLRANKRGDLCLETADRIYREASEFQSIIDDNLIDLQMSTVSPTIISGVGNSDFYTQALTPQD